MSDTFLSAKLSQANLTKLGATAADVDAKLTAFLAEHETKLASAAKSDTAAATLNADLTARLTALETNFAAFKAAPPINSETILTEAKAAAKAEASATATAILAKSGGQPLLNGGLPANDPAADGKLANSADPLVRFANDAKLQAEFADAASYAAFCKLESEGRVRISSNRK